jgi:hypothetical protein
MIANEALLRPSEKDEKASYRQFVSEVGYDCIKNLSPSDTFIYNVSHRECRGDKNVG